MEKNGLENTFRIFLAQRPAGVHGHLAFYCRDAGGESVSSPALFLV